MKKFTLLLVGLLFVLTSCNDDKSTDSQTQITMRYVETITHADGSTISLDYDEQKRIKSISYVNANDASLNRHYDITYNIDTSTYTVTYEITCGADKYVMNFNEWGALKSFDLVGDETKTLSTFSYYYSQTMMGAIRLELSGMVDKVSGGESKRIDWQNNTPYLQINEINKIEDNRICTYSTSVRYNYLSWRSNVHANVNLFNLLVPEYLQFSNMAPELASCLSVFGSRSYYLPTDVTVVNGRMPVGDNYEKLSEEEREFSYDTDANGYILKIYTGKDDNNTKELLYTISYLPTTESGE